VVWFACDPPEARLSVAALYMMALGLTIGIEVPVAAIAGFRRKREFAAVALVSLFTHPLLTLALVSMPEAWSGAPRLLALVVLEVMVVLAEWKLLVYALGRERYMLVIAGVMNALSFAVGSVLLR
jgi:hypothetical protein